VYSDETVEDNFMNDKHFVIPPEFQPGFEVIASLDDNTIGKLSEIIKNVKRGAGRNEFFSIIDANIDVAGKEDLSNTLFSLGWLLYNDKSSPTELALNLAKAYRLSKGKVLSDDAYSEIQTKLVTLLESCGSIKTTFKALALLQEYSHLFNEAHIVTDIRAVFDDGKENEIDMALMVHQLKIEYSERDKKKEFFVVLDRSDLIKLRDQVERAINKETTIKNNFENKIQFINPIP